MRLKVTATNNPQETLSSVFKSTLLVAEIDFPGLLLLLSLIFP